MIARIVIAALLCTHMGYSVAQNYPSRPIRLVVPFPPGGGTDLLARTLTQELTNGLGQQIVADNRSGAQGNLGAALVAKSPPDGYTILLAQSGIFSINPWIYKETGFDPVRDFSHISLTTIQPQLVVVNPRVPVRNLQELAVLARKKPDLLSFASGTASGHLGGELFKKLSGTRILYVPYKGGGPAMVDVVAGNVDMMIASPPTSIPMVRAGKLRAIAIAGPTRLAVLPDVPTSVESGFPEFDARGWYAISAPANTPKDIVNKLNAELARILGIADIKEKLLTAGIEAKTNSPEEMTRYVKDEYQRWGAVVRDARVNAE